MKMKRVLSVALSLVTALALLLAVHAIAVSEPEITISNAEVKLYDKAETVTIALNTPACYGIEGVWSTTAAGRTNSISLEAIETEFTVGSGHKLDVSTGKVIWVDYTFGSPVEGNVMIATYTIPADTPAGEYTVTFTRDVFTGEDFEPVDENAVYTATIQVTRHVCSDAANDGDHKCDDPLCGKDGVTAHSHGSYGKDGTYHWSICGECGEAMDNTSVAHDFTDGDCVCGAEAPVTAVLGDLDLDGDVDSDDLTLLARHVGKISTLSGQALTNANVDGDSDVDSDDLTKLARYVGKIIDSLD